MWIDEWLASQELVEWERDLVGTLKRSNRIKHRVIPSALEAARNQVACLEVRAQVELHRTPERAPQLEADRRQRPTQLDV